MNAAMRSALPSIEPVEAPADRRCSGCDQPGHEVGPLIPCRVHFRRGGSAPVEYCQDCLSIAEQSVGAPGAGYGAAALPIHILSVERLTDIRPSALPQQMRTKEILDEFDAGNARFAMEAPI